VILFELGIRVVRLKGGCDCNPAASVAASQGSRTGSWEEPTSASDFGGLSLSLSLRREGSGRSPGSKNTGYSCKGSRVL
jgi:hypothetical protein